MRPAWLSAVIAAALALLAMPAAAKEGVTAKLDHPVDLKAHVGTSIRVAWHLRDATGHPFGAADIYLRVSRCGHRPLQIPATARGRGGYSARVRVPKGGIRKLLVGLQGIQIAGGRTKRADRYFAFVPALHRDCP
jgi:hypothetical protein